ncbi:MAG: helix-turn-helix transcriptional regulator [Oscillospiraceae bacterium]|jgi:DNA-binding CsgD family transcriptional regulator|nr:helix-turn-helix transcriptional regulator [Oscillospiraceae bacterium]
MRIFAVLVCLLFVPVPLGAGAEAAALVTTRQELAEAVYAAEDGDTILVGDIEFHDYPAGWQILNSLDRVTVDKNLTVRGAKPDGSRSVLSGGSFIINGPQADSQKISCAFENILFDGGINGEELVLDDWEPADTEPEPYKAQFAVSFLGNVDAVFTDCAFRRYMHEYGSAFLCMYGDYAWAQPGDFLYAYRYNTFCALNLSLINCELTENTALYAGGAVYLEGERVSFCAENCVFSKNTSCLSSAADSGGFMSYHGEGGGAIRALQSFVALTGCEITENTGNRLYGDPNGDATRGGGVSIEHGKLTMTDCHVSRNTASRGGGLYILMSETRIEGCDFLENRAATDAVVRSEEYIWHDASTAYMGPPDEVKLGGVLTGMRSATGQGGGAYIEINSPVSVTLQNTSIVGNTAQSAYGGFYANYSDWHVPLEGFGKIEFVFCTYAGNRCETDYSPIKDRILWGSVPGDQPVTDNIIWLTIPGDVWEIAYVKPFGCVISDVSFETEYPRGEFPNADNGHNYFGSPRQAEQDGVLIENRAQPVYEIPSELLKTFYGGRFAGFDGRLYAGKNERLRSDGGGGALPWGFALTVLGAAAVGIFIAVRRKRRALLPPENVIPVMEAAEPPADSGEENGGLVLLTAREKEVAALLCEGLTQKEAAAVLMIGAETVKTHIKNIYGKLGVKNKVELSARLRR